MEGASEWQGKKEANVSINNKPEDKAGIGSHAQATGMGYRFSCWSKIFSSSSSSSCSSLAPDFQCLAQAEGHVLFKKNTKLK